MTVNLSLPVTSTMLRSGENHVTVLQECVCVALGFPLSETLQSYGPQPGRPDRLLHRASRSDVSCKA